MSSSQQEKEKAQGTDGSLAVTVNPKGQSSSLQETEESKPKKARTLMSDVWKYFSRVEIDGVMKAKCNGCDGLYASGGAKGTSHLNRHIKSCKGLDKFHDVRVMMMDNEGNIRSRKLDHNRVREVMTMAIIEHGLPYSFVEYRWIRELLRMLNPDVRLMTRKTIVADVMKFFRHQKYNLKEKLKKSISRICLTSDCWTSVTFEGYICLTTHFVDEKWILNSKILSFCKMEPPHSGVQLSKKVYDCLKEWGIENKVFSITLDNASANDNMQDLLKEKLLLQENFSLICNGEFFHIRCCSHILNLIVQEGLKVTSTALWKIRESIKWLKAFEARMIQFKQSVEQVGGIDTSVSLRLDVPTRWNSTYAMLESALKYRRVFVNFALSDSNYLMCYNLTNDEWNRAEAMCNFLRPFEKKTRLISGSSYPTANSYFMQVSKIEMLLDTNVKSIDDVIREMSRRMKEKFDKYWQNYNVLLALAVIFYPRWKLNIIKYCYAKIDHVTSSKKIAIVKNKLDAIFQEYSTMGTSITSSARHGVASVSTSKSSTFTTHHSSHTSSASTTTTFDYAFDDYQDIYAIMDHSSMDKYELKTYLEEPILKPDNWKDLDVLNWWKNNQLRFPILSKMVADILSISITTVASESTFSIGSHVFTKYRSFILPANLQALICTRNWLHGFAYQENACYIDDDEEIIDIFRSQEEPVTSEAQSNVVAIDDSEDEVSKH